MIIFGFILIFLGAFESLVIMNKIKSMINFVFERGDLSKSSSGIGGGLRIIRPNMPVIELVAGESKGLSHSWDMKDDDGYFEEG